MKLFYIWHTIKKLNMFLGVPFLTLQCVLLSSLSTAFHCSAYTLVLLLLLQTGGVLNAIYCGLYTDYGQVLHTVPLPKTQAIPLTEKSIGFQ